MRTVDGLMVCQLCSADNSVVVRRWQCRCPIAGRKLRFTDGCRRLPATLTSIPHPVSHARRALDSWAGDGKITDVMAIFDTPDDCAMCAKFVAGLTSVR